MSTRQRWALELEARAREHWTPERTARLLDGKDLPITPRDAAPLLRALGLLDAEAKLSPDKVRKYRQINHMALLLRSSIRAQGPAVRVLDAGCGRSYLSLLLAWCGRHRWEQHIEIVGVDRNAKVIEECERRAALAELGDVTRFITGDLGTLKLIDAPHAVLALHACDTATCDAIAIGVRTQAALIAVAPCCQAELARGWASLEGADGAFGAVWTTSHLRREMAAHVTDAMRMLLLRSVGYDATAIEFVPAEHTKKNTLIRAENRGAPRPEAREEYEALVRATGGVGIALVGRL